MLLFLVATKQTQKTTTIKWPRTLRLRRTLVCLWSRCYKTHTHMGRGQFYLGWSFVVTCVVGGPEEDYGLFYCVLVGGWWPPTKERANLFGHIRIRQGVKK